MDIGQASTYHMVEESLFEENIEQYGEMLGKLMRDNVYLPEGFDAGCWLTKSRKIGKEKEQPYIGAEIGMGKPQNEDGYDLGHRWGEMFYLSTDLWYRASLNEAQVPHDMNCSPGYFF